MLLFWIVVTVAVAAATSGRANRTIQLTVDGPGEEILDAIAAAVANGNRSGALRYLLNVYAGREFADRLEADRVFDVEEWRKPRLSRELASRVCGLVRDGNIRADAYALAGVGPRQAGQWLARGRSDVAAGTSSLYADFAMGLERAEAELKAEQVAEAKRKGDYKFILERQFPGQYAKRTISDSNVTHAFTPLIEWDRLTVTEARTLVALLRKGSPDADDPSLTRRDRPASELIPAEIIEHEPLQLEPPSHTSVADDEAQSEQRNSRDTEIDDLPNGIGPDEQTEPHADDYGAR